MQDWNWLGESMPWAWASGGGLLGRLMWHAKQVQLGRRKPLSWALFFDLPIAIGMGFIGHGLAAYAGITGDPEVLITISAGYLGTYMIDVLFAKMADYKTAKEPSK